MPANDTLFTACGKFHRGACAKVFVRRAGNPRSNGYSVRIYKESHDQQPIATPGFLSLQGGINFRDLGGQLAADGRRVRSGKLLRSGALNRLTAEDLNHLDTLPLSRVLDYRDPGEVARTPDKLSPLTHYLNAPANPPVSEVNAKVTELNAATLNALNGEQFMLQLYRQLPFNNPAYRQLAAWLTTPLKALYCNTARSAKIAPASAAR